MGLEKFRTEDKNTYIFKPDDCLDKMLNGLKDGKVKGSTTYNPNLDQCWTWRKQEANIWSGYSNEGKSLFLKQLCLIKALKDNWNFIFCSPEDFPPEEFYDDLIHTLSGMTTDKDYTDRVISEKEYIRCFNLIKNNFIFLYIEPPHNTIKGVLEEFRKICKTQRVDACIIDPLLKFARPKDFSERDDIYAAYIGSICVDFCRQTNTSFHLVMHQTTPQMEAGDVKRYPKPSMYRIKGGGSWSDGFDNILSIWRPNYASDKFDTEVIFSSQKIKKQKLVGIPQDMTMAFDRKSNRYVISKDNLNPIFKFDEF